MDVWDCALGFMNAQVLLTAEEIGVFDALDPAPRTAEEVAAAVRMPEDGVSRLLIALCALGAVERRADGRFANGADAAEKLVRGKPGYVGGMFRHLREDLYPVWGHLREALEEGRSQWHRAFDGRSPPTEDMYANPEALRAFMGGMHAITHRAAAELAAQAPEIGEIGHLVDVGGASGAFLIALAERHPALRGTVFDLPPVRPVAEEAIAGAGLADRLAFQEGSFWDDPLPEGADGYALGFILHDWDDEAGSIILDKVATAIRPGGRLILGEYLLDDDKTGPLFVARQDLNMLVAARGRERNAREYAEWLGRFGFGLESIQLTTSGKNFLLFRR